MGERKFVRWEVQDKQVLAVRLTGAGEALAYKVCWFHGVGMPTWLSLDYPGFNN